MFLPTETTIHARKKRLLELLKAAEISERNPLRDELDAAVWGLGERKHLTPLL